MGNGLIGRIARLLRIGGKSSTINTSVTEETEVAYAPTVKEDRYDSIFTENVGLEADKEVDSTIKNILAIIEDTEEEKRGEIAALCREILTEKDQAEKKRKIGTLVSSGAGMFAIALFIIRLKEMTRQ